MTFELSFYFFCFCTKSVREFKEIVYRTKPFFYPLFLLRSKEINRCIVLQEGELDINTILIDFFSPSVIEIIPFEKKTLAQLSCCECKQILWTDFTDLKCSHQKMLCSEMTRLKDRYNNSNF